MKKLFLLLAVGALALSSCKVQPTLTLSETTVEISAEGGSANVKVSSNCAWSATCNDTNVQISPASGQGDGSISITLGANAISSEHTYTVDVKASNESGVAMASISVKQLGAAPSLDVQFPTDLTFDGYAKTITAKLSATGDWTSTATNGATIEPASGTHGSYDITITLPENTTTSSVSHKLEFSLSADSGFSVRKVTLVQPVISTIEYAGTTYAVKWMADGRLWMVENLRYIPEGKAASSDPADNSGIWYPNYMTAEAKTAADSVAKYGLLYNFEAVWGIKPDTEEKVKSVEGKQGICPEGWHVPTQAEADALVEAYWNEDQKGAYIPDLEEAGFNPQFGGFVQQANSITAGKYAAAMRGYAVTSTFASFKDNGDKGISAMMKGLMVTQTSAFNRVTVANAQAFGGTSVRCIKNASAE